MGGYKAAFINVKTGLENCSVLAAGNNSVRKESIRNYAREYADDGTYYVEINDAKMWLVDVSGNKVVMKNL